MAAPASAVVLGALLMYARHPNSPNSPRWVGFSVPDDFIEQAEEALAADLQGETMKVAATAVRRAEALSNAEELESAISDVVNHKRKPGSFPVEPMVKLIQFVRDTATNGWPAMPDDQVLRALRMQAWHRATGELRSMLSTFFNDHQRFVELNAAVETFIKEVEDNGWAE